MFFRLCGRVGKAAVAFLFLFTLPDSALGSCSPDGSVCVEATATGRGSVDFWAQSTRPCALTLSVESSGTNLDNKLPGRVTTTMLRPGKQKLFSKGILQEGQPWSLSYTFHSQCGVVGASPDNALYDIPFALGQSIRVSQGFHGPYSHYGAANEYAVDFDVPEGTPIYAAREGTVVDVIQKFSRGGPHESEDGANVVRIEHADHTIAEYAHLRYNGALVKVGQVVERGELIAYSGNTGKTTGPHLHFAVHVPIDGQYRRSVPIRFATEEGPSLGLLEDKHYRRM